jgi:hypothetical protein
MVTNETDFITTYTGKHFHFMDIKSEEIDILDIAHALSQMCRFNGHTKFFYSVAQHSINVARFCDEKLALTGLLHDAAEAYIADIARPIKRQLKEYKIIEEHIERAIADKFGLIYPWPVEIKIADNYMLYWEAPLLGFDITGWFFPEIPECPVRMDLQREYKTIEVEEAFLSIFSLLMEPIEDYYD